MKSILVSISKIVLKILPFFLFLGCNSQKEIGLVKFEDPIIDDSEINFREREIFFPLFLDSLKGELRKR